MEQQQYYKRQLVKTASITYKALNTHPDLEYIKDVNEFQIFKDVYYFDLDIWDSKEDIICHINYDLSLVANGGYELGHIKDVLIEIEGW